MNKLTALLVTVLSLVGCGGGETGEYVTHPNYDNIVVCAKNNIFFWCEKNDPIANYVYVIPTETNEQEGKYYTVEDTNNNVSDTFYIATGYYIIY